MSRVVTLYQSTNIGNNPENGKSYIGFTIQGLKTRRSQHLCFNHQDIFHNAIRQWGSENFSWKVLAFVETNMRNISETKAIKVYNTLAPNGYNSTTGGEGGFEMSEDAKNKISESQKGEKHHLFGKHHSEESKRKISKSNKGKKRSEETKRKIIEGLTGRLVSKKTRRKMRKSRLGKSSSEETKRKLSESHIGISSKEKHPKNKYYFYCSDNKNYWNFTKNVRDGICRKFKEKQTDKITYKGITITRTKKEKNYGCCQS